MTKKPVEILLVESDVDLAEMLERCVGETGAAHVTHVTSAAGAVREELTTRHDLLMIASNLDDAEGLGLIRELRVSNKAPVVLLAEHPTVDEAIEALRLRVAEVLIKPFDVAEACEAIVELARQSARRRRRTRRYRRLREMSSRIVRERRDLKQRMDLICRDLVHAYRGLAQKVSKSGILDREAVK